MYYTTGLEGVRFVDLVERVGWELPVKRSWCGRRHALRLSSAVKVVLIYLRQNASQYELAERFGVSQATISRTIKRLLPLVEYVLRGFRTSVEGLAWDRSYLLDGTLVKCWGFKDRRGLWSGKHKRNGFNVQVIADLQGRLAWVSAPVPGSVHDAKAFQLADIKTRFPGDLLIADRGYVGTGVITPRKKTRTRNLNKSEEAVNRYIAKMRSPVEGTIAHLKNWKILKTGYRRHPDTLPQTLRTIVLLEHFRNPL